MCRALILLRHRDLLTPVDLLTLFFDLLKCQDKTLRKFLRDHIITDIKGVNSKGKDVRLNTALQNFMFKVIKITAKIDLPHFLFWLRSGITPKAIRQHFSP